MVPCHWPDFEHLPGAIGAIGYKQGPRRFKHPVASWLSWSLSGSPMLGMVFLKHPRWGDDEPKERCAGLIFFLFFFFLVCVCVFVCMRGVCTQPESSVQGAFFNGWMEARMGRRRRLVERHSLMASNLQFQVRAHRRLPTIRTYLSTYRTVYYRASVLTSTSIHPLPATKHGRAG